MPRLLYTIIAVVMTVPIYTCNSADRDTAQLVADSIYTLSRKNDFSDMAIYRKTILNEYDKDIRNDILSSFKDSAVSIRALVLVVTHNSDEIADAILDEHSPIISGYIQQYLTSFDESDELPRIKKRVAERFDAMSVREKAQWVVSTLSPDSIPLYLDKSDDKLVETILSTYDEQSKSMFRTALEKYNRTKTSK